MGTVNCNDSLESFVTLDALQKSSSEQVVSMRRLQSIELCDQIYRESKVVMLVVMRINY